MNFGTHEIEAVQRMVAKGTIDKLNSVVLEKFSLGAVMELACCYKVWKTDNNKPMLSVCDKWASNHAELAGAIQAFDSDGLPHRDHVKTVDYKRYEIYPIPLYDQWQDTRWIMFQDRFHRSMVRNGFGTSMARALSMAMVEMADNVTQHSGPTDRKQSDGIVGYHVEKDCMSFSIADIGRGILQSLWTNPKWASIASSQQALESAVLRRATRRLEHLQGNGYYDLLLALADLNGILRFRSGDASLNIDGRGEARQNVASAVPSLLGLQLTVTCSRTSTAETMFI